MDMTRAKNIFLFPVTVFMLWASEPNGRALEPLPIEFSQKELRTCTKRATQAVNSASDWGKFPGEKHESHYDVVQKGISYLFYVEHPNEVVVVVPTTKADRHPYYVQVTFDHFGKILAMREGHWL